MRLRCSSWPLLSEAKTELEKRIQEIASKAGYSIDFEYIMPATPQRGYSGAASDFSGASGGVEAGGAVSDGAGAGWSADFQMGALVEVSRISTSIAPACLSDTPSAFALAGRATNFPVRVTKATFVSTRLILKTSPSWPRRIPPLASTQ